MKKTSLNITKFLILFITIFLIQGCTKFTEEQTLKRKNIYDRNKDTENVYSISVHSVEVVKEDGIENGLLEVGETVWYRVKIINTGTEPALVNDIDIERSQSNTLIVNNSSSSSNFTFSLEGTYVAEKFLEPGEIYILSNGKTTSEGEIYSYNLRRPFETVGNDPSMQIIINTGFKYENLIENIFKITPDFQ